jgi:hypothetical protein
MVRKLAVALGILMCATGIGGTAAAKFHRAADAQLVSRHRVEVADALPPELNPCWCQTGFTALKIEACRRWRTERKHPPERRPVWASWFDL